MRFITWNCNGGFWKKFKEIDSLNFDLLFVQECENPNLSKNSEYKEWAKNYLWVGDNKNKGVAFFAKTKYKINKLEWSNEFENHNVKYFSPIQFENQKILGVWAHSNNSPTFGYIGQFWKYLQINETNISNTLILGDLNSNKVWDKWDRWWNHSDVVKILNENGIFSIYHDYNKEQQGSESISTYYMHRNQSKGYHIDYMFSPNNLKNRIENFEIGSINWLTLSDHLPLICDIKN